MGRVGAGQMTPTWTEEGGGVPSVSICTKSCLAILSSHIHGALSHSAALSLRLISDGAETRDKMSQCRDRSSRKPSRAWSSPNLGGLRLIDRQSWTVCLRNHTYFSSNDQCKLWRLALSQLEMGLWSEVRGGKLEVSGSFNMLVIGISTHRDFIGWQRGQQGAWKYSTSTVRV